ncbi:hypothetical protein [Brevundimonas sp. UBA7664]|uniref:hypothetical protein n=1 Tax=Brevundimonas sp. UBA7664 TaxID=1946141 RepID=UPI0025BD6FE3|nr:hypothetical protein [Brevundimonas sp. UBA7664]
MTEPTLRLAQYRAFAEARLHFSRLFFQTVAFVLSALIAAAFLFRDAPEPVRSWLMLAAGAALLQTAFISWRLRRTEGSYADRLAQIEGDGSEGPAHPRSGPLGAKTSVTAALALAGVAAAAAGLAGLT